MLQMLQMDVHILLLGGINVHMKHISKYLKNTFLTLLKIFFIIIANFLIQFTISFQVYTILVHDQSFNSDIIKVNWDKQTENNKIDSIVVLVSRVWIESALV